MYDVTYTQAVGQINTVPPPPKQDKARTPMVYMKRTDFNPRLHETKIKLFITVFYTFFECLNKFLINIRIFRFKLS